MNFPMRNWRDFVYIFWGIIATPVLVEIMDLLKGKISRKEFLEKLKTEKIFVLSFIGSIFFVIFTIVYLFLNLT